jgi:hypothetical protein
MKTNKKTKAAATTKYDWDTDDGKREIVWAIFEWLHGNDERIRAFRDCKKTRTITEDDILHVKLPADAEIFCFREGDESLGPNPKAASSLILEIPPDVTGLGTPEILQYACSYNLWATLLHNRRPSPKKRAQRSSKGPK